MATPQTRSNRVALTCLALVALIGLVIGSVLWAGSRVSQTALDAEVANADSTRRALEFLREGKDQQSIETLEVALSLNVLVLDEFLRELDPPKPDTAVKVLRRIASYREQHPYSHSLPRADDNVARILADYAQDAAPAERPGASGNP